MNWKATEDCNCKKLWTKTIKQQQKKKKEVSSSIGLHAIYSYSTIIWHFVTMYWNSPENFMMTDKYGQCACIRFYLKFSKSAMKIL